MAKFVTPSGTINGYSLFLMSMDMSGSGIWKQTECKSIHFEVPVCLADVFMTISFLLFRLGT